MRGNVQKVFTGPGVPGRHTPMSMTHNRISVALLCLAAAAGPACATTQGLSLPGTASAGPASAAVADPLPGLTWEALPAPEQVAQYSPTPPRGRPVADHDHARETARAGENRGFDELMRSAQSRGRGEYLGVEPDIGRNVYRFKFLRSGGNVVWVDVDGRTGRVIAERD